MGTRYVPFGYEITYGALAVIPQEERLVKSAFELYISGKSFKSIADRFTMTGIEYREGKPDWNKNMIKRMIAEKMITLRLYRQNYSNRLTSLNLKSSWI